MTLKKRLRELNWRGSVTPEQSNDGMDRTNRYSVAGASSSPMPPLLSHTRDETRTPTPTPFLALTSNPTTPDARANKLSSNPSPVAMSLSPMPGTMNRKSVIWSDELEKSLPAEIQKDTQDLSRSSSPSSEYSLAQQKSHTSKASSNNAHRQLQRAKEDSITALPSLCSHSSYQRPHSAPPPQTRADTPNADGNKHHANKKQAKKLQKKRGLRIGGEYKKIGGPVLGSFSHVKHMDKGASVEDFRLSKHLSVGRYGGHNLDPVKEQPQAGDGESRVSVLKALGPTKESTNGTAGSSSALDSLLVERKDADANGVSGPEQVSNEPLLDSDAEAAGGILPSIEAGGGDFSRGNIGPASSLERQTTESLEEELAMKHLEQEIDALEQDELPSGMDALPVNDKDTDSATETGDWEDITSSDRGTSVDDEGLRRLTFETKRSVLEDDDDGTKTEVGTEGSPELGTEEDWEDMSAIGDEDENSKGDGKFKIASARGSQDLGTIYE